MPREEKSGLARSLDTSIPEPRLEACRDDAGDRVGEAGLTLIRSDPGELAAPAFRTEWPFRTGVTVTKCSSVATVVGVHALQSVRGKATFRGIDDLSLPPLNVISVIGLPPVVLAVVLEEIHTLRQRRAWLGGPSTCHGAGVVPTAG
jgi:hypothetical protein